VSSGHVRSELEVSVVIMRSSQAVPKFQPVNGKPGSEANPAMLKDFPQFKDDGGSHELTVQNPVDIPVLPVQPDPEAAQTASKFDELVVQNPENVPVLPVQPGPEAALTASKFDELAVQNLIHAQCMWDAVSMELDVPEIEKTSDPPVMGVKFFSIVAEDIIKHSVKKSRAQPSKLGNMIPNA
jgi:hypothetical protein